MNNEFNINIEDILKDLNGSKDPVDFVQALISRNRMDNTIKLNSPTTVINIMDQNNANNKLQIIGMIMLTLTEDEILKLRDMNNIKDNSILGIKDVQKVEAIDIMDGIFNLLKMNNDLHDIMVDKILKTILEIPSLIVYSELMDKIRCTFYLTRLALNGTTHPDCNDTYPQFNIIECILKSVWFIPYDKLDNLYYKQLDLAKKEEGGTNNDK